MDFYVTVLGSSSATLANHRGLTSHVVNYGGNYLMIDCGEGTQLQMRRFHVPMQKINHIFISHLHGDHFYGLVGLLSTYHLYQREAPLHIYAHEPLQEIIDIQLRASQTELCYPVHFHTIPYDYRGILLDREDFYVHTFPLLHSIPTNGFVIREKTRPRKISKEAIEGLNIPNEAFDHLKKGKDYSTEDGRVLRSKELTTQPPASRSYAFCSDTGYTESFLDDISEVTLLYHEATFMKDDVPSEKLGRYHTTAEQAATIARQAKAKQLLLGHFSGRYESLGPLREEATRVFANTNLVEDGQRYVIHAYKVL
ncbi:MAG: ribonuclease Z [Bacteroidales bacterium]|nr:ribonuclease Z [Bacteroidales bacterium]